MKASCKLILSILGYCLTLIQIISAIDVIPNSYIIEFNGSPNNQTVSSFESSAKNDGINYKFRETFNQIVFNGVSIKLENDRDISKIKKLKEVKNVWPVAKIQRTEFKIEEDNSSTSQNLRSSIGFIEESEQPKLNSSEIKVGIIDTGIDYNHPALGGCFKTEGCKVQFGFDFVGDDFDGSNEPNPDDDPLDECVGHGTHAAGIIAGEDSANNITGIAPNVKLGAYRIFGCNGGTTNDLVIKAMGQAFEDGMNIINLSLVSGDNAWFGGPESLAAEKLTENGIFVVAPAGSSGDKGIFKVSSPSTAPGVISVASFDTEQINSFFIQPSCDPTRKIQYLTQDEKAVQLQNSFSITPTSNVTNSVNDACETINEDLTGIIALVRRGGCDDTTKINIIQAAGASAIILYNNASGIALSEFDQNGVTIPVAMISCEDGVFLFNRIQENNSLTIQFSNETVLINNPSTLKVSEFSSFGPTYEMDIKPDIAAPGNNILSAFPISLGSFKSLSGSSVSAPFITGALALYMQNKEESTPELVRNVIQNNAKPFTINIEEDNSLVATTILQQGAGLVNLANALSSTVVTSPTKLALNDSAHFNGKNSKLTLTNIGKETTKFTFNHLPAQSISGFDGINVVPADSPIIKNSFANVKFSKPSIRLRPGESQDITLMFTPPKDEGDSDNSLYSGYIVITDSLTKKNSYVSYMGMKGCMNTLPIFDDQSGAPFIQSGANDIRFTSPDDVLTVSMKGDDIVLLGVRMALGTRIFTVDVIPDESAAPAEPTETQPTETEPTETEQPTETQTGAPKETTENPLPTDKAPSQTETQSSAPTETTENPLPTETQPNPILAPTETIETPSPNDPPTETQQPTQPDDVVIVTSTSTITTTITPAAVETPGAEKRSFTKIYKRKNNKLQPRAFDQSTTELLVPNSLGTMTNVEFQSRNDNSEVNQVVTLQFDGIVDKLDGTGGNELPDGKYRLFLAALKPFGNPEKKEDWETFTSSIIEIKRD